MSELADQQVGTEDSQHAAAGDEGMDEEFIYVLGRIEPRFPSLSIEKEFAQATGRAETAGLTDRESVQTVLSGRENRYLARQLCWVLTIEGLDTYILHPADPADLDMLTEAVQPTTRTTDVDVVIGRRGPLAPPQLCNGLMVPIVLFSQIYSFDVDTLIKEIPMPDVSEDAGAGRKRPSEKEFRATAEELFWRIMQLADNAGATDEHRALNYLALRYPAIYEMVNDAHARDAALTGVDVRPSRLSGVSKIMDVIFTLTDRNTDVSEKFFVRVDVTSEFPFLVSKLAPYYDR